jgi:HD superfamily phosphodiesterase
MKNKLTPKSAETFAKSCFKKIKGKDEYLFHEIHSEGVVKTALRLAEGKKADKNILIISGWLHDIGISVGKEGHAKNSFKLAEQKFGKLPEKIKDCILKHGRTGKPRTSEAKIIQLADKLSIIQDTRIFNLLFSEKKHKEEGLKMYGSMFKELVKILERYNL